MTDWDLTTRDVPRARRVQRLGGIRIVGDCRVPLGHMIGPHLVENVEHTCTLDEPCEARQLAAGRHSHDRDSSMTHTLNVARRNSPPHQPRHCACRACVLGFTHVAQVVPK